MAKIGGPVFEDGEKREVPLPHGYTSAGGDFTMDRISDSSTTMTGNYSVHGDYEEGGISHATD